MIEQQDNIKNYLTDKMSNTERQLFEASMQADDVLTEEVMFNKDLMSFLEDDNPEMEKMLMELGNEFSSQSLIPPPVISTEKQVNNTTPNNDSNNKKWLLWLIGILMILAGVWWFSRSSDNETSENTTSIKTNSVLENGIDENNTKLIEESNPEKNTIEIEDKLNQPGKVTPKLPTIPDFTPKGDVPTRSLGNDTQPMAKADYTPNNDLELLIVDGIRSSNLVFELNQPKDFYTFYEKEKQTKIVIEGTINQSIPLEVIIYDNSQNSFSKNQFVLKQDMRVKAVNDEFTFSFIANTTIPKGLYYFFIYNKQTQEMLTISKFSIK